MWYSIFLLKASTKCLSRKGGPELCVVRPRIWEVRTCSDGAPEACQPRPEIQALE